MKVTKKDPPSFMDVIKAALLANPATSGATQLASALMREGKERLAENLKPYGYTTHDRIVGEGGSVELKRNSPEQRVIDALMGESEYSDFEKKYPSEGMKERQSLFRTILGLEGDELPASEYMEGAFRSPVTESSLKSILNNPKLFYSRHSRVPLNEQTMRSVIDELIKNPSYAGQGQNDGLENVLGTFTINKGKDDRGEYIDYYDEWDLNPFTTKRIGQMDRDPDKRYIEDFLYDDVFQLKTPKIYGRVYMDELMGGGQETPKQLDRLSKMSIYDRNRG